MPTKTPMMTRDPQVEELLNMAERQAVKECEGMRADPAGLWHFSHRVKHYILVQAVFGQWAFCGITSSEGMANLKVNAVIDKTAMLMGKPPIRCQYDFSQTACPHIITE